MTNINRTVWDYIDRKVELQKTLADNLVNISSLARKIAKEKNLVSNIDAVISAIRRYETKLEKKEIAKISDLLKQATISTKTKLSSIVVVRNNTTENKTASIHEKAILKRNTTLRSIELTNFIKIVVDDNVFKSIKKIFLNSEIISINTDVGEIEIAYKEDVTKIPGLSNTITNELALNDVSVIDSIICHLEHIIIVNEKDIEKAFNVIHRLTI